MNYQILMREGNSRTNFSEQCEALHNGELAVTAISVQSHTIDIFHDEVRQTRRCDSAAVKLRDICMTKAGEDSFFSLKTPDYVARAQPEFEKLDCHSAA